MSNWPSYPKVADVHALPDHQLLITFRNGERRHYDFKPLLSRPASHALQNSTFFATVKADPFGYGIIWNDELDLAESELWLNGTPLSSEAVNA